MEAKKDLFTAAEIAKVVGVSDGKVKKAIKDLNIQPSAKRGVCNYYSKEAVDQVKTAVGK